ncbi:MAG: hypothetical protein JWR26_4372 [Pedosphaera sp.]|nr:hypothetical protein [Pedosphaera sp.]
MSKRGHNILPNPVSLPSQPVNRRHFLNSKIKALTLLAALLCWISPGRADERIRLQSEINGKPVRLIFDTGASDFILVESAANRLGLKVRKSSANEKLGDPDAVLLGTSEECSFLIGTNKARAAFRVIRFPEEPDLDGLLGWGRMKKNIFLIDPRQNGIKILKTVPEDAKTWMKFAIVSNQHILSLEEPIKGRHKPVIALDTGSYLGVELSPTAWKEWKSAHSNQPSTLTGYYSPNLGLVIKEEAWADRLSLGPLELTDVPIMEADRADVKTSDSPYYHATLGMAALHGMEMVIDGKHHVVYLRKTNTPAPPYEHNRLGAVFVDDGSGNKDRIGYVIEGSPAYRAGIRNGDILLKIDQIDVEKADVVNSRFNDPPGTKIELTLKRGDSIYTKTVELQNILGPASSLPKSTK